MRRLILILVTVLLGVCAYYLYQEHGVEKSDPVATTPRPVRPTISAVATGTSKCCTFGPDDPLPAPAAVSSGPEEERAILLAQQVLAGGAGTLPALVAALQQAGFPIRDASGEIVMQPIGKSQGIVFELWEVNALAQFFANRKQVMVPLDNFAEVLTSPLRELQGAPMTDFLLDGVRRHARDEGGSMLFWAVFIAELGRQNQLHEPYDILFDIDPAKTQLDVLQIVLITKRMAADIAVLAYPDRADKEQAFQLPLWPASNTVWAAELPCKMTGVEGEISDWTQMASSLAFSQLFAYLIQIKEVAGAEKLSTFLALANVILAYEKLAIAQSAFDIKFEMQGGAPLVRTREQWPRTGEKKTIVATLKMDMGNSQLLNCFRVLFNLSGLEFTVEKDGPIEGASVAWSGGSGFGGQLVQFVGDPGSRIQTGGDGSSSPILDAPTDKSGRASVDVEGVGQRQNLGGDPKPVTKEATAVAMAVLKPANMYRDLKEAISRAQGGLIGLLIVPADLMYRTHWSFGGSYTFPVKDWKPGNDRWTGTITDMMIKRQIIEKTVDSKCCGGRPITSTQSDLVLETVQQKWEITSDANAKALTPEFAAATASYSVQAGLTSKSMFRRTGWNSCKGGPQATWSKHTVTQEASASLNGKAEVGINFSPDGSYSIALGTPDGVAHGDMNVSGVLEYGPGCQSSPPSQTSQKTRSYSPPLTAPDIEGTVDPNDDRLSGSITIVEKDSRVGIITTHTYTWRLTR
jgi:hypothetical protein